jgi:hypothetical protein
MDFIRFSKLEDNLTQISSIKEEEEIEGLESRRELTVPILKTEGSKS